MQKVFIFDDDADILELCSLILTNSGFEVIVRNNCENVVETVAAARPDVILMDNWLPDTGGVRATKLLKASEATSHIPVIFFSANNQTETFSHEAGADFYIQKPFNIEDLVHSVSKVIKDNSKKLSLPVSY